MDIERINEYTVKFYISYVDIEERGFDREEIWSNRDRSEELFWEMMDEIHQEEEFTVEGPLWIQVQAMEKGIEVVVTKAQLSRDGNKYELPIPEDKLKDFPVDEKIESLLDQHFNTSSIDDEDVFEIDGDDFHFLIGFLDFEDVVSLSHRIELGGLNNRLFSFEGRYFLFVEFTDEEYSEEELDNMLSILLEYGQESQLTVHRLEEYGHEIIKEHALAVIAKHFPLQ